MLTVSSPLRNYVAEKLPQNQKPLQKSAILSRIVASGFLSQFTTRTQATWLALWSHAGSCIAGIDGDYVTRRCFPSVDQLAGELGISKSTALRALRELRLAGALVRDRRGASRHYNAGSVLQIPKLAILLNASRSVIRDTSSEVSSVTHRKSNTNESKPQQHKPVVVSHTTQEPAQPAQTPPARPQPTQPKQVTEWRDATSAEMDAVAALPIGRDGMRSARAVETIRAGGMLDQSEAGWLYGVIRSERPAPRQIKTVMSAATVATQLQKFGMATAIAETLAATMPTVALAWLDKAKRSGKGAGFIVKACREGWKLAG